MSIPLLLVPGLLCTARLFTPQTEALWPQGPVMIADHRQAASVEAIAAQILAAAPPRFALAGLSMGGYIAFAILRHAPERVERLALLDTSARPDTEQQTAARRTQIAMVGEGRFAEIAGLSIPRFLHRRRQSDPVLTGLVETMAKETGPEAFLRQLQAIIDRPDSRPMLPSIRCPTLVLVGDGDEATPPELSRELAGAIPGARLTVVPDCGHLSTLEQPDAVNRALRDWLSA